MEIRLNKELEEKLTRDYRREIQLRALDNDENPEDPYYHVEGKAVVFNEETVLFTIGGIEYKEEIKSGAFDGADINDVVLKFNHESSFMAAARTRNKTLELDIRADGVYIIARLDKNVRSAVDLYQGIKAGLLDRMSFAFSIAEESYDEEEHKWAVYRIKKVFDVAAVEYPAYDNTMIYARRHGDAEARQAEAEAKSAQALNIELARAKALAIIK